MKSTQPKHRGAGRPPLIEFTLTEPGFVPMTPGQRARIVAVLADIIVTALDRKRRADRCQPEPPD